MTNQLSLFAPVTLAVDTDALARCVLAPTVAIDCETETTWTGTEKLVVARDSRYTMSTFECTSPAVRGSTDLLDSTGGSPMPPYPDHTPIPAGFKRCTKCGEVKPATKEYFHADSHGKDGLHAACKTCVNVHTRQWKANNPEYMGEYRKAHHAQVNANSRQWYADHPDQEKTRNRQWKTDHPTQVKVHKLNRRARKHGAEGTHDDIDCLAQYKRQHGKCYYCHRRMKPWGWKESCDLQPTTDHVIPLSRGGSNGPDNLVIACRKCNEQKHTKLPHEWPEGGRLL